MGSLGLQEILVIAFIILLLFGGKKIPELMKGLGKGVKNFKDGMNGLDLDEKTVTKETTNQPATTENAAAAPQKEPAEPEKETKESEQKA